MKINKEQKLILDLLTHKAALKQDIADFSEEVLRLFKRVAENELTELAKHVSDPRIRLRHEDKGKHEFRVFVGSDTLVFQLHSNIFRLPDEHSLWQDDYLKNDETNGYFAIINVYNFLAESFEQNRLNDVGYLLGRVYINREHHFFVEGDTPIGAKYNNPGKEVLSEKIIRQILRGIIAFSIEFDLIAPPLEMVQEISLMQIQTISSDLQIATGKRLGFRFSADDKEIF